MALELLIIKFIQEYQAYRRNCRKEDDILVKQKIIDELSSLRTMIIQFTNEMNTKDFSLFKAMKSMKNAIDVFIQDVEYSLSGHSYPFFSPQTSVGPHQLKKIMKFDLSLLEKTKDLISRFEELQNKYIDAEERTMLQEFRLFNQMIAESKNKFRQRNEVIKKINGE